MILLPQMATFPQPFVFLVNSVFCSLGRLFVDLYALNLIIFDMQLQPRAGFSILYQFERHIKLVVVVVVEVIMIRINYREVSFDAVKACPDYFFHAISSLLYVQQPKLTLLKGAAYHLKFRNINSLRTFFSYN